MKRIFDLLLAMAAAVVLAGPVLLMAVAVRLTSPGPALSLVRMWTAMEPPGSAICADTSSGCLYLSAT